jgi:CDP-paratose 2-epimerase
MPSRNIETVLVTGGAGFIGSHAARHWLHQGMRVRIYDNLSRRGAGQTLKGLLDDPASERVDVVVADVRDARLLADAARDADLILHSAAQTAVTTSLADPRGDFEANALGTFNLLEAARLSGREPIVLFTSTNKVYGGMEGAGVRLDGRRYRYTDLPDGVPESWPLDFHSPYGCSKGAGDQYTRDYARIYNLPTVVFRQSCIYGPQQFGSEDQGWLAHFTIAAVLGHPVTIYGDGKQARDALYIDDLLRAFDLAVEHIERTAGQVYNIGGGPDYVVSLLELIETLEEFTGQPMRYTFDEWRPGDQRIYVSDISRARADFGWEPRVSVQDGVRRLYDWASANRDLLIEVTASPG